MKIAIIVSQFNKKISDRLLEGAKKGLLDGGLNEKDFEIFQTPGAFEMPFAAQKLADSKKFDGMVALGCVLKGETDHYRAVCNGVIYGIQKVSIGNKLPIMFGVLMCERMEDALARSAAEKNRNKGYQCAKGLLDLLGKSENT